MSRHAVRVAVVVLLAPVAIAVHAFLAWSLLVRVGPWFEIPALPAINPPPSFVGEAAEPRPLDVRPPPQHPFMAPNGRSSIHVDAYMSDANVPRPAGAPATTTTTRR